MAGLKFFLSGGVGNTNPNASLGGVVSTTEVVDAVNENLYDDISRKEILLTKTEFRCYYIKNDGTNPVHGATLFIDAKPPVSLVTMGLDPAGAGNGSTFGVAQTVSLEDTPPTGVIFEDAQESIVKLALPTILNAEYQAIWLKRINATGKGQIEILGLTASGNEEALPSGGGPEIIQGDGLNLAGERTTITSSIIPFRIGVAKIGFSLIEP